MTTKNTGGPAFPLPVADQECCGRFESGYGGMSLRDWFAAKAMQGLLAHATRYRPRQQDQHLHWHAAISKEAYELADAMLKASEDV